MYKVVKTILLAILIQGMYGCAHKVDNLLALDKTHRKQQPLLEQFDPINIVIKGANKVKIPLDIQFLGVAGFAFIINGVDS